MTTPRDAHAAGGIAYIGRVGYEMEFRYCNLTANSWMWQKVEITETGIMRDADGDEGGPTTRVYKLEEIFRTDDAGCTIDSDSHASTARTVDDSSYARICPLCSYYVVREAWQADNVKPKAVAANALESSEGGVPDAIVPADDPDRAGGYLGHGESKNYHMLYFERWGTPCLFQGMRPVHGWRTQRIHVPQPVKPDAHWKMIFWWAIPCGDDPVPPPPTMPSQPRCGSVTGVPTVVTSPDFTLDGEPLRPGRDGWTRTGPEGRGREPVPRI